MSDVGTIESVARPSTAPDSLGDKPLPKRNGSRGIVPYSWISRGVTIEASDPKEIYRCTLLDFCGLGLVVYLNGARCVLPYERISLLELSDG